MVRLQTRSRSLQRPIWFVAGVGIIVTAGCGETSKPTVESGRLCDHLRGYRPPKIEDGKTARILKGRERVEWRRQRAPRLQAEAIQGQQPWTFEVELVPSRGSAVQNCSECRFSFHPGLFRRYPVKVVDFGSRLSAAVSRQSSALLVVSRSMLVLIAALCYSAVAQSAAGAWRAQCTNNVKRASRWLAMNFTTSRPNQTFFDAARRSRTQGLTESSNVDQPELRPFCCLGWRGLRARCDLQRPQYLRDDLRISQQHDQRHRTEHLVVPQR